MRKRQDEELPILSKSTISVQGTSHLTQQDSGIISDLVLFGFLNGNGVPHAGILIKEYALCVEKRFKSQKENENAETTEEEVYNHILMMTNTV